MFSLFTRRTRCCSESRSQSAQPVAQAFAACSGGRTGPRPDSRLSSVPRRIGLPDAPRCPVGPQAAYRLVYNDPEDPHVEHPVGWVVSASRDGVGCWNAALIAHGAGTLAGPRQAKAVAVRALRDRGILIDDWDTDDDPTRVSYRARVRPIIPGPTEP